MFRVAICDDNNDFIEYEKDLVCRFLSESNGQGNSTSDSASDRTDMRPSLPQNSAMDSDEAQL